MNARIATHMPATPHQQRGAALLVLLALVVVAASYALLKRLNQTPSELGQAADTAAVLGRAKAALIGYALKSQLRPGELPCPDSNNTGESNGCAGNVTFRLPWKTLGLSDLRDSSGARLWYAVDPLFSVAGGINSNTPATQTIDGEATSYVAVIIAPGKSLKGQSRSASQQNNILRYLESDNANNDAVFVTAAAGDFNDQLLGITRDELIQAVERRVLKEASKSLNAYYDEYGYFPNPASAGGTECDSTALTGMIPLTITATCGVQDDWGGTLEASLPDWFSGLPNNNNWNETIWYVVSSDCVESTRSCGANLLTVNGPPVPGTDIQALLIAGGIKLPGVIPPQVRPATNINDLLDTTVNTDGDTTFKILPIDTTSNDQIQVVAP